VDHETRKAGDFAWNLRVNVGVEILWGLGLALVSTYTVLPVFLSRLGASERLIALVPGITLVGPALLQLPSAYFTTRLKHKRSACIWLHVPIALAWMGAAWIAWTLAGSRPGAAQAAFMALLGASSLIAGIGLPLWADLVNRQTPARTRGRFLGWTFAAGSVAGLLGGYLTRRLVEGLGFPSGFGWCFFLAGAAMLVGLLPYVLVRETSGDPTHLPTLGAYAAHVREVLARRGNLRRLVLVRCLLDAGMMGAAFYAVRALEAGEFPDSAVGTFTVVATAAQAPGMLVAGYVGERWGFRAVMAAGGLLSAAAALLALVGGPGVWFYGLFACAGLATACDLVSVMNLVMDMSPEADKTIYQALYATLLVPVRVAYPLLAGWLAETHGVADVLQVAILLPIAGTVALVVGFRRPPVGRVAGDQQEESTG
jgi:MFS family permease